jgi:hypothetical protein
MSIDAWIATAIVSIIGSLWGITKYLVATVWKQANKTMDLNVKLITEKVEKNEARVNLHSSKIYDLESSHKALALDMSHLAKNQESMSNQNSEILKHIDSRMDRIESRIDKMILINQKTN